jgi:hypothetical protein
MENRTLTAIFGKTLISASYLNPKERSFLSETTLIEYPLLLHFKYLLTN